MDKGFDVVIEIVRGIVKDKFEGEGSGHDWWHIHRVVESAKTICLKEGGDLSLVEISALVHDYGDDKLHGKSEKYGEEMLEGLLVEVGLADENVKDILNIVKSVSFKGGHGEEAKSLEAMIVQDADRLDAIGAIGIGRAFAYGGNKGRIIYDPENSPKNFKSFEDYRKDNGPTINHFYEKLLLLKDKMKTKTGREMAEERHKFMESFLEQFYNEWPL